MIEKPAGMPENLCTDPKAPEFFQGASFEHKAAVLKRVSPARYGALETLLHEALRDEFQQIGKSWTAKPIAAWEGGRDGS